MGDENMSKSKTTTKKFTCKEIMNGAGGCNEVFEGKTTMEILMKSSKHFMASTDNAHKPMRDMMTIEKNHSKEEQAKWFAWFNGEWDKK
jgi:hypothetical protein